IDAQGLPGPRESIRFGSAAGKHGPDHGFLNWGEPFCRLLDHEAIMPILRFRLGDCFRLDRLYGLRMQKGQTMGSMHADYEAPAGSVVLFSEAVMHGTAPWRADHERRTLLYKYCVSQMAWSRARVLPPPDVKLTTRQEALLTEPADPHTFVPSLFSDGRGAKR